MTGISARAWDRWIFLFAVLITAVGFLRLVTLPEASFVPGVIVDDAFYFLSPAHNLLAGHDYTFDGLHRTNGVQALWAIYAIFLSAFRMDPGVLMRVFCLSSGLLWILAAVLLRSSMNRVRASVGTLAAVSFLFAGMHRSCAVQGMENGLHAFLSVLVLAYALRRVQGPIALGIERGAAFRFGLLIALFALSRTEGAMLAGIFGVLILFGTLRSSESRAQNPGFRLRVLDAFLFSLPFLLLVGGYLAFSKLYFDSLFPVSGEVKSYYEDLWGRDAMHGPPLSNLAWHFASVSELGLAAWTATVKTLVEHNLLPLSFDAWKLILWIGIALGFLHRIQKLHAERRSVSFGPAAALLLACCLYVVAHLILMGLSLPHFTNYGIWYFASESLALCVGLAFGFSYLADLLLLLLQRGRFLRLSSERLSVGFLLLLSMIPLLSFAPFLIVPPSGDPRPSAFLRAGRWLELELPAGSRVGCFSAGIVNWYAKGLHVINLDGLANSRGYLDEVLRKNRLREYLDEESISWFADYQKHSGWRNGISWSGVFPIERMQLLAWWGLDPSFSYCIWRLLPKGQAGTRSVLRNPEESFDRLAELRFAAATEGRFPLIAPGELADFLAKPEGRGRIVAASVLSEPSGRLRHVMLTQTEYRSLGFSVENLRPEYRPTRRLAERLHRSLELLGVDVLNPIVPAGASVCVTRFFHVLESPAIGGAAKKESAPGASGSVEAAVLPDLGFEWQIGREHSWSDQDGDASGHREGSGEGESGSGAIAQTPKYPLLSGTGTPCAGTLSTTAWRRSAVVVDTIRVEIPAGFPKGEYSIRTRARSVVSGSKPGPWVVAGRISVR